MNNLLLLDYLLSGDSNNITAVGFGLALLTLLSLAVLFFGWLHDVYRRYRNRKAKVLTLQLAPYTDLTNKK